MTDLTDAELDALTNVYLPTVADTHRVIAELRALREELAAAELRESVWRAGPDSTFELAQQNAKLVAALKEAPCKCDVRYRHECPDCGASLTPVPQDTRLNEDQWDAVKAGDFYCSGECKSEAASSGRRYFRYRQLATFVNGTCERCAALASVKGEHG